MVTNVFIRGFDEFVEFTNKIDPHGPPVFFYFDSKLPDGVTSWCPDCVIAEPVVRAYLNDVKKDLIFVHVDCGPRDSYRDPQCVFRTDARSKIRRIPTLLRWQGPRLEEADCIHRHKLAGLLEA